MHYVYDYDSPLGEILLAANDKGLTGLWFQGQKYFAPGLDKSCVTKKTEAISSAIKWLDEYFSGIEPTINVPLDFEGSEFQKDVWNQLCMIPYGETVTYGHIAKEIAKARGLKQMSAQAVGGAVGHNKIGIIVPCHRVVGSNGSLTGYAGGISKKRRLLEIEHAWQDGFFVPKNSTAP